jgi:SH3 domain-containing YSC84-like protein 1
MSRILKWAVLFSIAGCYCLEAHSQTASLNGSVNDAVSSSPIGGVNIVVGTQGPASGITSPDGRYLVSGLKRGSKVTLTYDKWGYGRFTTVLTMSRTQVTQDVSLFKETMDAAYWNSWSKQRIVASSDTFVLSEAWKEVEQTNLSSDAKSAAARGLLAVASSNAYVPGSLRIAAGESPKYENPVASHERQSQNLTRPGAGSKDESGIKKRLDGAAKVLDEMMATPGAAIPDRVMSSAKCIVVVPSKVTIVGFGGSPGKGVATCRTHKGWSAPAPITVTGGSWGYQVGLQAVDLVMIVTNDNGMQHLLSSKFKLGADASSAAGPVGRDASADTDWKMKAEVLTYSRARGVFAGIDLNGSAVTEDSDGTRILYGRNIPLEVILDGEVPSPRSNEPFLAAVRKLSLAEKD